tara:strand:+ start:25871 stop:26251 length:381 start_codon:yes stop_codon:yes gene_type:complete
MNRSIYNLAKSVMFSSFIAFASCGANCITDEPVDVRINLKDKVSGEGVTDAVVSLDENWGEYGLGGEGHVCDLVEEKSGSYLCKSVSSEKVYDVVVYLNGNYNFLDWLRIDGGCSQAEVSKSYLVN